MSGDFDVIRIEIRRKCSETALCLDLVLDLSTERLCSFKGLNALVTAFTGVFAFNTLTPRVKS